MMPNRVLGCKVAGLIFAWIKCYFDVSILSTGVYQRKILFMISGNSARKDKLVPNPKLRLREQVREVMRFHHYSIRTEESYWFWIRKYILFHGKRHPKEMGG